MLPKIRPLRNKRLTEFIECKLLLKPVRAYSTIYPYSTNNRNSGQKRPVFVKRLVMADTVEERLLGARRSLSADQKITTGTQLCGASAQDSERVTNRPRKRQRTARGGSDEHHGDSDEDEETSQRKQRIAKFDALFGFSATKKS